MRKWGMVADDQKLRELGPLAVEDLCMLTSMHLVWGCMLCYEMP